jgi:hypothetical protein
MWYYEKEFARATIRVQARTTKDAYNELLISSVFHLKYSDQNVTGVQILKEKGQNLDLKKEELSGNLKIKTF